LSGKCKSLVEAGQAFSAAIASAGGSDNDLEAAAKAYQEFAAKAPAELKDDFKVLADIITKYAAELKDLDLKPGATPTADQLAKLTKLGQSFNGADVQKAAAAVAAWAQKNCATP
jgi:phage host-nuclease inhibitor protein Gam